MKLSPSLIAPCVGAVYRAWCKSLRYEEVGRTAIDAHWAQGTPMLFALWHDELFPLIHMKRQLEIIAVVSQSQDGEYLSRLLESLGLHTARGSSSRGGVKALLQAARLMRTGKMCGCVTVDGPRGPRHQVKDGAIYLAHKAGVPIVPVRMKMLRAKVFTRAWDQFQLPLPFSSVVIKYGTPYFLDSDALDSDRLHYEREKLQGLLEGLA